MQSFNQADLQAPFEMDKVHWRAQTLSKDGTKALALAYIDSRDVQRRLDEVIGVGNWQTSFEVATGGRVLCKLSIRVDGEWITKSDGAGDTKVEAEKGGISDAFKRAAVMWGIGRYLYDMETPWVPCESYKASNGKLMFKKFTADPWQCIKSGKQAATTDSPTPRQKSEAWAEKYLERLEACKSQAEFFELKGDKQYAQWLKFLDENHKDLREKIHEAGVAVAERLGVGKTNGNHPPFDPEAYRA